MPFPLNPTNGESYINGLGTRYVYNATDNKWVIQSQSLGLTGAQGYTGPQGITGLIGTGGYTGVLNIIINNNDRTLTPGQKCEVRMPFNYKIRDWYALCSPTGCCSALLLKTTFDSYPTFTAMNGVTGMWIDNNVKNRETGISWSSPTGAKDDIIRFVIDSTTGIQTLNVSIGYNKI